MTTNNHTIRSITFFEGERRVVDAAVGTIDPLETVVVSQATWTLKSCRTGEIDAQGDCEIDGTKLSVFFGSEVKGQYELEVTAHVGRETIKQRVIVIFQ